MLYKKALLLAAGDGTFEVISAEEGFSQGGLPMTTVRIKVWDKNGLTGIIYERLTEKNIYRGRALLRAGGLEVPKNEDIEIGEKTYQGKKGSCCISVKEANDGYDACNQIKTYYKSEESTVATSDPDDDVPF